jgi:hypothetical protein
MVGVGWGFGFGGFLPIYGRGGALVGMMTLRLQLEAESFSPALDGLSRGKGWRAGAWVVIGFHGTGYFRLADRSRNVKVFLN